MVDQIIGWVVVLFPAAGVLITAYAGLVKALGDRAERRQNGDEPKPAEPPAVVHGQPVDYGPQYVADLREQIRDLKTDLEDTEAERNAYYDELTSRGLPIPRVPRRPSESQPAQSKENP